MRNTLRIAAPIALAMTSLALDAQAQTRGCVVRGRPATLEVTVSPEGAAPFSAALTRVPVDVTPAAVEQPARVDALGALRFAGESNAVTYTIAAPTRVAGGVVTLARTTELTRVRSHGRGVALSAELREGVTVHDLPVPCDALSVDPPAAPEAARSAPTASESGPVYAARNATFVLRESPGRGAGVQVETQIPALVRFHRSEVRGAWAHVAWHGDHGTALEGWIPAADIAVIHGGAGAGSGSSNCYGRGVARAPVDPPGAYRGPATLALGSQVFARPGASPWATVNFSAGVMVVHARGSAWVRLVQIDGIEDRSTCGEHLCNAWLPRSAVVFPPGVVRP